MENEDGHEVEIAVVYFRAGYTPNDYLSELDWSGRLKIERSFAIKCPSITYHLAGAKKVQQVLAAPGVLERFLSPLDGSEAVRESFAGLWELGEDLHDDAKVAVEDAIRNPGNYVIKPQREGGGNNIYGEDVRTALSGGMTAKDLNAYILMSRIFPREKPCAMLRAGEVIIGSSLR
jgi:glutathione synthetase